MRVPLLRWEDQLEEGMAMLSGILVWRIPWIEEPGGLQFVGSESQTRLKRLSPYALPQRSRHHGVLCRTSRIERTAVPLFRGRRLPAASLRSVTLREASCRVLRLPCGEGARIQDSRPPATSHMSEFYGKQSLRRVFSICRPSWQFDSNLVRNPEPETNQLSWS